MKSVRCAIGVHIGQENGGTMMFWCPRCETSQWQKKDMSRITAEADKRIDQGDPTALDWAREQIRREMR